jgi:hypothetical protein
MSLAANIPNIGIATSLVIAGLSILSLLLSALTSRPPSIPAQDSKR